MEPYSTALVELLQLAFFGGLLVVMVGLPAFIWLLVRACRDLRAIRQELEYQNSNLAGWPTPAQPAATAIASHDPRPMTLSQFGR